METTRGQENTGTTLLTRHVYNDSADDDHVVAYLDLYRGYDIFRWMVVLGVYPVCVLGLAGNALSVWVWNAKEQNTLAPLFQCLGLADILYLLTVVTRCAIYLTDQRSPQGVTALVCVTFVSQSVSVHTTLTIGVFRWLTVAKPQQVQRMTRQRVMATWGGLVAWIGVLTVVYIWNETAWSSAENVVTFMVLHATGIILPVLLLLGFSIALLVIFREQRLKTARKHRRVTLAVLCIAGCTCLAYPVANGVDVFYSLKLIGLLQDTDCSRTCSDILLGVRIFLQALNSSVNFVIYYFVASKFRQLLRRNIGHSLSAVRNLFRPASAAEDVNSGNPEVRTTEESAETLPPGLPEGRPQKLSREDLTQDTTSM